VYFKNILGGLYLKLLRCKNQHLKDQSKGSQIAGNSNISGGLRPE